MSQHDDYRLNSEPESTPCPECSGEGIIGKRTCDLCEGGCYVPSLMAGQWKAEQKETENY